MKKILLAIVTLLVTVSTAMAANYIEPLELKQAFEKNGTLPASPFNYDNIATSGNYTNIGTSDDNRWVTSGATSRNFDSQIYLFNITEDISNINSINISIDQIYAHINLVDISINSIYVHINLVDTSINLISLNISPKDSFLCFFDLIFS